MRRLGAGVLLRIDDVDAARGHGDVVDVGPRSWDATVVQEPEVVGGESVEPLSQSFLAEGAGLPGGRRLRVVAEAEDQPADLGVLRADPLFALVMAPFVLAPGGAARGAEVDRCRGLVRPTAREASDRFRRALVDSLDARRKAGSTETAGSGVPQLHALLVGRLGHHRNLRLRAVAVRRMRVPGPEKGDVRAFRRT